MSDKKFNLTQTGQQVQDILNSAKSTDQVLTEIQEAMENLPDGQAVSAQVALNTAAIQELDDNKASKTEVVFDISAYHATGGVLAEYADLTAALGTNGANIPDTLRKGGMSVKYVQSSDHKYVQFTYLGTSIANADFTNVANWQGMNVDDEPTVGSNNLVKSGGIKSYVDDAIETLDGEIDEKLEEYTKFDGYYETMGVGTASNLKGDHVTNGTFLYRKTGGSEEIVNGGAFMEKVMGNTVAWNQIISNKNEVQSSGAWLFNAYRSSYFVVDHKYFCSAQIKKDESSIFSKLWFGLSQGANLYGDGIEINYSDIETSYKRFRIIVRNANSLNHGVNFSARSYQDGSYYVKEVVCIDLTIMFGGGNEPSTVEEFESWLATNVGLQSYYPYNEGELIPVKMTGMKSVGFNQWDEEWEVGYLGFDSNNMGQPIPAQTPHIRTKNFIQVLPTTLYFTTYRPNVVHYVWTYDANGVAIGILTLSPKADKFTTPSNCHYIKFCTENEYGTTYNHDICINLSDEARNGEYESYWENVESVDVCQLQGKENGTGDLVTIFPDGMKRAGSVYDEIKVENGVVKAIKRVGSVDLKEQTWNIFSPNRFYIEVPSGKGYGLITMPNSCSVAFKINYPDNVINYPSNNLGCYTLQKPDSYSATRLYVAMDTEVYSTVQAFETYLNALNTDTTVYYELATPIEYVVEDLVWPLGYRVDNDGTEEVLIPAKAAGDPDGTITSCAPTLGIRYDMEAVETLKNLPVNYMSMASVDQLLSEMSSAMNGVWTKTWDEQNHRYSFSFTPNAEPEPQPDSQEGNG